MYNQRRDLGNDERKWSHRILGGHRVVGVEEEAGSLRLRVRESPPGDEERFDNPAANEEVLCADLVIAATGYERRAHVDILRGVWDLLPRQMEDAVENGATHEAADKWFVQTEENGDRVNPKPRVLSVARDYQVQFAPGAVVAGSGIWLQGCCEATHGVSFRPKYPLQLCEMD